MERQEDIPCLVCGKVLMRAFTDFGQPNYGIGITTHGNYGSTVWDDMEGEALMFNVCDACIKKAAEKNRIMVRRTYVNVTADSPCERGDKEWTIATVVGSMRSDRPEVIWKPGMPGDGMEPVHLEHDVLIEYVRNGKVQLHGGLQISPNITYMKEECERIWAKEIGHE